MRKVASNKSTAGMLTSDFTEIVNDSISSDKAFTFMNNIKGTPEYQQKFLFDVLAMVKKLGVPTLFTTSSSADLRWNELICIISELNKQDVSDKDI